MKNYPELILDHQKQLIDRVVHRCKDAHGMLIYHEMGTGKTLEALLLLNHFKKNKRVVFYPKHLAYVWNHEQQKYKLVDQKILFKSLNFIDKMVNQNDFKNHVVIIDEAHNLVKMFREMKIEKMMNIIRSLQNCKKVFLLTGTPLSYDMTDLSVLINIVAGFDKIPYDLTVFYRRYLDVGKKATLYNYILGLLGSKWFVSFISARALFKISNLKAQDQTMHLLSKQRNSPKNREIKPFRSEKIMKQTLSSLMQSVLFFYLSKLNDYSYLQSSKFGILRDNLKHDFASYIDYFFIKFIAFLSKTIRNDNESALYNGTNE